MLDLHHGKEVFNFFTIYNLNGIISILFFSVLMFFVFYKILNIKLKYNLENYSDFLDLLKNKNSIFNNKLFLFIINIFLAATFYIMLVALSTLFNYQFGISKISSIELLFESTGLCSGILLLFSIACKFI